MIHLDLCWRIESCDNIKISKSSFWSNFDLLSQSDEGPKLESGSERSFRKLLKWIQRSDWKANNFQPIRSISHVSGYKMARNIYPLVFRKFSSWDCIKNTLDRKNKGWTYTVIVLPAFWVWFLDLLRTPYRTTVDN